MENPEGIGQTGCSAPPAAPAELPRSAPGIAKASISAAPPAAPAAPSSALAELPAETLAVMQAYGVRQVGNSPASQVYRSRELSTMDASQTAALDALKVQVIYDLRKPTEVRERPTPRGLSAEAIAFASDIQDAPDRTAADWDTSYLTKYGEPGERMGDMYRKMAHHGSFFSLVFHMILAKRSPTLFHCVNGKDRAGVVSAQMLRLAGADDAVIYEDYLRANIWNAARNAEDLERRSQGRSAKEIEVLRSLFEAREEYLQSFFAEIDALHGSFDRYAETALRITDDDRTTLCALLGLC